MNSFTAWLFLSTLCYISLARTQPVKGSPDAGRWDSLIDENIDKVAKQQEKQVQKETLNKETSNPDVAPLVEPVERTGPQQELNAAVNVSNKVPVVPPPPPYTQRQKQKVTTTEDSSHDFVFYTATGAASAVGIIGLIAAAVCYYRLQKNVKAASEAEYPAYGVTGPTTKDPVTSPGDRKLAQSAQMYHYQHQKQQMIALEKANSEMKHDASDEDSEEENEEGDYTVYECPGLAPTGEMEVKNPLFSDDTPATPPSGDRKDDK